MVELERVGEAIGGSGHSLGMHACVMKQCLELRLPRKRCLWERRDRLPNASGSEDGDGIGDAGDALAGTHARRATQQNSRRYGDGRGARTRKNTAPCSRLPGASPQTHKRRGRSRVAVRQRTAFRASAECRRRRSRAAYRHRSPCRRRPAMTVALPMEAGPRSKPARARRRAAEAWSVRTR